MLVAVAVKVDLPEEWAVAAAEVVLAAVEVTQTTLHKRRGQVLFPAMC